MAEDKFEQAVIDKLKSEGWEYLTDYSGVTVDRLYDHWRDILNANNRIVRLITVEPRDTHHFYIEQFQNIFIRNFTYEIFFERLISNRNIIMPYRDFYHESIYIQELNNSVIS